MRYAIEIENAGANFSAYVRDLPGCVAMGATLEEVEREIREAIEFQLDGLREDGSPIPPPAVNTDRHRRAFGRAWRPVTFVR